MEIYLKIVGDVARDNEILAQILREITIYPSDIPVAHNPAYDYRQYCKYKGTYHDGFLLSWRPTPDAGILATDIADFEADLVTRFGVTGTTVTDVTNTTDHSIRHINPDIFLSYEYGLYNNKY